MDNKDEMQFPPADNVVAQERLRAFGLLFMSLVAIGMGQTLFFSILPPVARDFGLSEIQVSTIFSLSAILWVLMSPVWGRLSDVWGRKPVILLGLTGFAISTGGFGVLLLLGQKALVPLSVLFGLMILTRAFFGLLGSGAPAAAQAYVADRTTRAGRTTGVAAIGAAFGLGTVVGPGFAAALATYNLLAPFFMLAVFALIGVVALAKFLPERRAPRDKNHKSPRLKVSDPRIRPFLIMGIIVSLMQAAVMQVSAFFVMDSLFLTATDTTQLVGVGMMAMALATLFAQLVVIPRANLSVRSLLVFGIVVNTLGLGLLLLPTSFGLFVAALTLQGFGSGLMRPAVAAGGSLAVTPEEQGAVAGYNSSTAAVGVLFVPIFMMPLYLGVSHHAPFFVAFILSILMLVFTRSKTLDHLETPLDIEEHEEKTLAGDHHRHV